MICALADERRRCQGSMLVVSYFMVAVLVGLVLPQMMRALHNLRLEDQRVQQTRAFEVAEAGLDYLLSEVIPQNLYFGRPLDDANTPYLLAGTQHGVNSCPGAWEEWDCLTPTLALPDYASNYTFEFRARNLADYNQPEVPISGHPIRKNVQIIVKKEDAVVARHEALIQLKQRGSMNGVRTGTRLQIQSNNSQEQVILKAQQIYNYGIVDDPDISGNWNDYRPVTISNDHAIWGDLHIKQTPGNTNLCCVDAGAVKPHLALSTGNTIIGARVRDFPTDPYETLRDGMPVFYADWAMYNSDALNPPMPTLRASNQGNFSDPNHIQFLGADEPQEFTFDEVTMSGSAACQGDLATPSGSEMRTLTLCEVGNTDGVCGQNGGADILSGDNQVRHIGQAAADGSIEYCAKSFTAKEHTEMRFQGDKVRVYATGYRLVSGAPVAFEADVNSHIFSFKKGQSSAIPGNTSYIPTTAAARTTFVKSLPDNTILSDLSLSVLESNKWMLQGAAWVPDPRDYDTQTQPARVPEVRINGDYLFGTINAPRSLVTINVNLMETRSTDPLQARRLELSSGILAVTPPAPGFTGSGGPDGPVELIGWRRCYNLNDCSN